MPINKMRVGLVFLLLLVPVAAFAQIPVDGDPTRILDWREVVALLINGVGVMVAVQILKHFKPQMSKELVSILALVLGPVLGWAGTALSEMLGYPIDLSPIALVFSGVTAGLVGMGVYDVQKRVRGT